VRVAESADLVFEEGNEDDELELEDTYHDPDTFVSMSVIEHEMQYLGVIIQKYKNLPDEKEFFTARIESL